ncbi:MAG: hypothetical protein SGI77_15520 [Pirellulaceae bacterium]|nr:hypothetical protein [Pirellulaceae bacterium]
MPSLVWATYCLASRVLIMPRSTIAFCGGVFVFVLVWRFILRFHWMGPWLMRAEHEATHLLFALLTFHPIVGLSREEKRGSHVRFLGSGNWIIQIAPYFFPTAAVILWLFAIFLPLSFFFLPWTSIALGIATGFHVVSTIREIRRDQKELIALSWKFCWMFLPSANILMLGFLIAFSKDGFSGLGEFIGDMIDPARWLLHAALGIKSHLTESST